MSPRSLPPLSAPSRRAHRRHRAPLAPSALSVVVMGALLLSSVAMSLPAFAASSEAQGKGQVKREEWLQDAQAAAKKLRRSIKAAGREGKALDARISQAQQADAALGAKLQLAQAAGAAQPARPAPERPARAAERREAAQCRGRLMVEGVGIEMATPDVLRVSFGAQARADGPGEALSQASEATQSLLDAVLGAGVAKKDVSTTRVNLNPVYNRPGRDKDPEIVAWEAGSSLAVTLKDVSKFGALATAATEAGATSISGVSFAVSDAEARLEEARQAAVKAAMARAELLAKAAGARVGQILELSEIGVSVPGPRPMFARAAMSESVMADMPIAEGAQELRASVTATVELCQ